MMNMQKGGGRGKILDGSISHYGVEDQGRSSQTETGGLFGRLLGGVKVSGLASW